MKVWVGVVYNRSQIRGASPFVSRTSCLLIMAIKRGCVVHTLCLASKRVLLFQIVNLTLWTFWNIETAWKTVSHQWEVSPRKTHVKSAEAIWPLLFRRFLEMRNSPANSLGRELRMTNLIQKRIKMQRSKLLFERNNCAKWIIRLRSICLRIAVWKSPPKFYSTFSQLWLVVLNFFWKTCTCFNKKLLCGQSAMMRTRERTKNFLNI